MVSSLRHFILIKSFRLIIFYQYHRVLPMLVVQACPSLVAWGECGRIHPQTRGNIRELRCTKGVWLIIYSDYYRCLPAAKSHSGRECETYVIKLFRCHKSMWLHVAIHTRVNRLFYHNGYCFPSNHTQSIFWVCPHHVPYHLQLCKAQCPLPTQWCRFAMVNNGPEWWGVSQHS